MRKLTTAESFTFFIALFLFVVSWGMEGALQAIQLTVGGVFMLLMTTLLTLWGGHK